MLSCIRFAGTRRPIRDRGVRAHDLQGYSQVPRLVSPRRVNLETNLFDANCGLPFLSYSPYIQPIHDPSPTILPTRHLFKDAQGQWREVIGDEAAERILGVSIDRSEGKIYQERWIESVSGIEYQTIERESVVAGRRGWVSSVGERLIVGASGLHTGTSRSSRNDGMRTSSKPSAIISDAADDKPRRGSFSATSPGRPVGQRSSRDAPPPPVPSSAAHIGRAL